MADIKENTKQNINKSNDDLNIFLPHELSDEERIDLFEKFAQVLVVGSPKQDDVFVVLYNFFNENEFSPYFIEKYYDTYWFIFVKLGWKILPKLQDDVFANLVARTLPYAVSEYVNVKDILLTELFLMEPPLAQSVYNNIKRIIIYLNYPIAFNNEGKKIIISDLIKQFPNQQITNDLIQKALFPDAENDVEEVKKTAAQSTKDFIELLRFFAIKPEDISEYAGDYFRNRPENQDLEMDKELLGELGANLLEEYASAEESGETGEIVAVPLKETKTNLEEFLTELSKHKTDFVSWITTATTLRSLLLWLGTFSDKVQARKELAKNLETTLGNESLTNNDLVLAVAHLNEFLVKNGYTGDDFFHFEESDGSFKWGK